MGFSILCQKLLFYLDPIKHLVNRYEYFIYFFLEYYIQQSDKKTTIKTNFIQNKAI